MSLEARSGHKILLKLLLDKQLDIITSVDNMNTEIVKLQEESQESRDKLILLIKQLEHLTGEHEEE
jgi:hypothetical protein